MASASGGYAVLSPPLHVIFPNCREVRLDILRHRVDDLPDLPPNLRAEVQCRADNTDNWPETFATVARRYYQLDNGIPRDYLKLSMPDMVDHTVPEDCNCRERDPSRVCPDCRLKAAQCGQFFWVGVPIWTRRLGFHEHSQEYHAPDPMWWYSQEDGLLVYPAGWQLNDKATASITWAEVERGFGANDNGLHGLFKPAAAACDGFFYRLFDPETGEHISVPFDVRGKIIRRVRLAHGVLILEWTEIRCDKRNIDKETVTTSTGYKQWAKEYRYPWYDYLVGNDHAVTAFDVVRTAASPVIGDCRRRRWTWDVRLRFEWALPTWGAGAPRGEPWLDEGDNPGHDYRPRFFSAHTATHYALFIWQRLERLPDQPDELRSNRRLYVWDMGPAAQDATSRLNKTIRASKNPKQNGPILIRRILEKEMWHHHRIGHGGWFDPRLRNIAMDEHNVYLVEDDHRWATFGSSAGTHALATYSIPVLPFSSVIQDSVAPLPNPWSLAKSPVFGPQKIDACPDGHSGFAYEYDWDRPSDRQDDDDDEDITDRRYIPVFCRHFDRNNREATHGAPPIISCAPYSSFPKALLPSSQTSSYPWNQSDTLSNPLQPRNFPGFSPCWRHENFPYVGISSVTDHAAGVRYAARDSRPLHILTPLLAPTVTVSVRESSAQPENGSKRNHTTSTGKGNYGSPWVRPRAALLDPSRPPPPDKGPQTIEELKERHQMMVTADLNDDLDDDGNDDDSSSDGSGQHVAALRPV